MAENNYFSLIIFNNAADNSKPSKSDSFLMILTYSSKFPSSINDFASPNIFLFLMKSIS